MTEGWCPKCGPTDNYDEDGCCNACGCDANGDGADQALAAHREMDGVHWCDCGQPWKPATGLYGTTESMQCYACTLRQMLKRTEEELRISKQKLRECAGAVEWATEQLDLDGQLVEARTRANQLEAERNFFAAACVAAKELLDAATIEHAKKKAGY